LSIGRITDVSPDISWSFDPIVLVGVLVLALLYWEGWRRARASGEHHRIGFGRLSQFAKSLVKAAHPVQDISVLPTRVSVVRSESQGLFERQQGSFRIARFVSRAPNLKPQQIIPRSQDHGLFQLG